MATFPLTEFQQYAFPGKIQGSEGLHKCSTAVCPVMEEASFLNLLRVETKRSHRSGTPCLLMLVDAEPLKHQPDFSQLVDRLVITMRSSIRETDVLGWSRKPDKLAVLFSGLEQENSSSAVIEKMSRVLRGNLASEMLNRMQISYSASPSERRDGELMKRISNSTTLVPEHVGAFV